MSETAPITRLLSVLLVIGMIILGVACAVFLLSTLIMLVPSGLRDQLFAGVSASKSLPTPNSVAIALLGGGIVAGAWFFVLKTLRKVVKTVIAGDPFVPENISRLRMIWVVIAAAEIFRMVVHWVTSLESQGGSDIDIRIGTWFLVFVIATLSEAFRYGAEMRREQELTI